METNWLAGEPVLGFATRRKVSVVSITWSSNTVMLKHCCSSLVPVVNVSVVAGAIKSEGAAKINRSQKSMNACGIALCL